MRLPVIPAPASVVEDGDTIVIDEDWALVAPPALSSVAGFLHRALERDSNLHLVLKDEVAASAIELRLDPALDVPGDEGHVLSVKDGLITIAGKSPAGTFRGIQTLRQLVPLACDATMDGARVPRVEIRDAPRFPWRGFMLDVARHFFDVPAILQLLDAMALLKLNVLHLHLCDDQGWRIEIDRYPRLVAVGATRPASHVGGFLSKKTDGIPHSGFFTKEDIKTILDHATERFITVVPEIEMPGHCTAALAAYPHLGCTGGPYEVAILAGIKKDVYCPGKDATISFLEGVLDEVMDLFPSTWIHIGGDEVPKNRWKACPDCQARMVSEGLLDEHDLQAWFVNRMVNFVERHGRVAIGWNEILSEALPPSVVAQHWLRGKKRVVQHLRKGGKIVGSHFFHSYLDYNHGIVPLSKVYSYNPVPKGLEPRHESNIMGIEAPMWTEFATTPRHVHAFVFPRLVAVAENAWTPAGNGRDFGEFLARLPSLLERIRRLGIAHASIKASQPPLLKRLAMWLKLPKQSSELPAEVVGQEKEG